MLHINCPGHHCFIITLFILALTFPITLFAEVIVVNGSIQDAVDAANPGDLTFVPPGLYSAASGEVCGDVEEALVCVDKNDITIRGSKAAIIDATGFDIGILVGPRRRPPDCPQALVSNFTLQGLTIQNAEDTGVRLVGVKGFSLTDSVYLDNEEYGPFPVCSSDGVIARNYAEGHEDAAIYVGNDDNNIGTRRSGSDGQLLREQCVRYRHPGGSSERVILHRHPAALRGRLGKLRHTCTDCRRVNPT